MILELQKYLDLKEKICTQLLFHYFKNILRNITISITTKQKVWLPPSPLDLLLIGWGGFNTPPPLSGPTTKKNTFLCATSLSGNVFKNVRNEFFLECTLENRTVHNRKMDGTLENRTVHQKNPFNFNKIVTNRLFTRQFNYYGEYIYNIQFN